MRLAARIATALSGGILISFFGPLLLIKLQVYSDAVWVVLALGWVLFSVGSHDLFRMITATVFDTAVYGIIIYFALHLLDRLVRPIRKVS